MKLIHQHLYAHAHSRPAQPALQFGNEQLSYGQLADRAATLAHWLQAHDVQAGDRVGIYLPKGMPGIVAMLAILSAGAVYVPLDPTAPPARAAFAIRDCNIHCLIGNGSGNPALQQLLAEPTDLRHVLGSDSATPGATTLHPWSELETAPSQNNNKPVTPPPNTANPTDLAYIIYTSGSTGQPKGIMHSHRSGLAFARWAVDCYHLSSNDRLTSQAPLHFDMSIFDLFGSLVAGATAIIVPDVVMRLPAAYTDLLARQRATVLFTVPFVLSQLLLRGALRSRDLSTLRWIIFGGDNHSPDHIRQLMQALPATRFSHMYGPAETNGCTYHHLQHPPDSPRRPIPIGHPCEGMQAELRDPQGQPVSDTDSGEIWVSGATLMQGYWNRPDLTKRVLIDLPGCAPAAPGQRWCRTGDLAERLSDGQLRFLGRRDRQIKLRGFRVELEEIETLLLAHPAVEEAAVFPIGNPDDGQSLGACVITAPEQALDSPALLHVLQHSLPRYAVPDAIQITNTLPRTPSGKIDRRALSAQWSKPRQSPLSAPPQ